jgi:hypothetical protein
MTSTPPPEPSLGQDDEPPDLGLLLTVVRQLLIDVEPELDIDRSADLRLRAIAVRRVIHRYRTQMEV